MLRFIIFLLFSLVAIGQAAQASQASLKNAATPSQAQQRLSALLGLPYDVLVTDLEQGRVWADSMLLLARRLKSDRQLAQAHQKSALIHYYQGNYEATVADHLASIKIYQAMGDSIGLGHVYVGMGYQGKRRDLALSISHMHKGIALLEAAGEKDMAAAYDNLGVLYEMKGDYTQAGQLYQRAYDIKVASKDSIGLPYSLDHLGGLAALQGDFAGAEKLMLQSYSIRKLRNDRNGMAESRMYQSELYKMWGKPNKMLTATDEAIQLGKAIGYADLVRKAYAFQAEAYAVLGKYEQAYQQQLAYTLLNDSLFTLANNNRILQLEKKFQTAQKEQENLQLSQEKEIQALELAAAKTAQARLWWAAIASLLALSLSFGVVFIRYQAKQRAEKALLQKQNFKAALKGEEKERQRIARELHDGVGQMLAAAKLQSALLELQLSDTFKPKVQEQLALINEAMVEIRQISHNLMPVALSSGGLFVAIQGLCERIQASGSISPELYIEDSSQRFEPDYELSVYRMVQEVLSNMLKHAAASRIGIDIHSDENALMISIRDNGKGFQLQQIKASKGIGWANLQARTDLLGGTMEVQSAPGEGTSVFFELPFQQLQAVAA
jgi:signal transduction histidine kinase